MGYEIGYPDAYNYGTAFGTFILESGRLVATDPCYEKGSAGTDVFDALKGEWDAYVRYDLDSGRPASLAVVSCDAPSALKAEFAATMFVDSGQGCFWDWEDYDPGYPRYDEVCDLTLSDEMCGVLDRGAVSSSGFGDGAYPVVVYRGGTGDPICAAEVSFILSEDDDDYDDDYDEDDEEW